MNYQKKMAMISITDF